MIVLYSGIIFEYPHASLALHKILGIISRAIKGYWNTDR